MSTLNHETIVVEKEFSKEQAGERVGWVYIDNKPYDQDEKEYLAAHIATATVGEDGGIVRKFIGPDGTEIFKTNNVEGFSNTRALYLLLSQGEEGVKVEDTQEFSPDRWQESSQEAGERLLSVPSRRKELDQDQKVWTSQDFNLIDLIKNGLAGVDATKFYPNIYYYLNGHVTRPSRYDTLRDKQNWQQLLFPDPEMHSQTQELIEIAKETLNSLRGQQTEDNRMLEVLTPFSDVKPEDISQTFKTSRLAVGGLEKVVMQAQQSPFGDFIYLPIGFRSSGRSWPYMDASDNDEQGAFGRELSALEQKNIKPAQGELERELSELTLRADWTSTGLTTLEELAKLESFSG